MKFFFDNCISERLTRAFAIIEHSHDIVHLKQKYHQSTTDVIWISELSREGDWVIVSGDARITRQPEARRAWLESSMTAFFFSGNSFARLNQWKQVEVMAKWWPLITQEAREYRVGKKGGGYLMPVTSTTFRFLARDQM